MRIACYGLLLAALAGNAQTGMLKDAQQSRILALEKAWNQAIMQKDAKAVEPLLGDELIYIDYDGTVMNKAQYLQHMRSPETHFEHIESDSMQVEFFEGTAVVIGMYREKGSKGGKAYLYRERFVDTWINRSGSWICVASQSTLVAH